MASIGTISVEDYTTTADVGARIGWGFSSSRPKVTPANLPQSLAGTEWFDMSTSSANYVGREPFGTIFPVQPSGRRECELTCALLIPAVTTSSANQFPLEIRMGSTSSTTPRLRIQNGPNPMSGLNDAWEVYVRDATAATTTPFSNGLTITPNQLLYATLRMESNVDGTSADGQAEVWVNGVRVYSQTGIQWATSTLIANWSSSTASQLSVRGAFGFGCYARNFMLNDQFTTAFGTAPEYKHVFTPPVNATVGALYTNEGGAATTVEAVTDGVDATYMQTTAAAATASFDFDVPAALAGFPVRDIELRVDASRGNLSNNDINIELRNGAQNVLGSSAHSLSAVDPTREEIQQAYVPSSVVNADNFIVAIINGS